MKVNQRLYPLIIIAVLISFALVGIALGFRPIH
jgi:hypothetical protein